MHNLFIASLQGDFTGYRFFISSLYKNRKVLNSRSGLSTLTINKPFTL